MTNAELIKAIRDEDNGLGEHAMLSARIIHNSVVTMQVAYLQWKNRNQADEAMVHIEGLLEDTDNIPAEGYAGCGDISNTANPMVYFRNNHLSGDLSPYQSRLAPLIDDLERRMDLLQKSMDLMTAERDHWKANHDSRVNAAKVLMDRTDMPLERVGAYKQHVAALEANQKLQDALISAETELAKLREQEPVAFWWIGPDGKDNGGPYSGKPSEAAIDSARNMGCEAHLLYSDPVPAPAVTYGIDAEAANRISLAVYDWKKGINPEPLLYAINRILATEAHPLSAEGQRAMLQSSPKAPAVPEEWRKVMAELTADLQAACDAEHPHRDQYPSVMRRYNNDMEIVEKARALLQSALQSPALPNLVESHQIKAPDCQTCANRGRVDGLSQETHCEHCCHQPSIGLTSHYAPISESVLALSSESTPEGMILMPVKADERLVAGFVGCETREEAMLGWDVAVRMQEVRTGERKPADPAPFYEAEVIRLQKELDETRDELGKVRDRIADRIKSIESPFEVKNPTCPACGDGTTSLCDHDDCPSGRYRGDDPMTRLIVADPKMKNPNCPREPIAKCVSGFCINEKAGREKCEDDSLLAGRPSLAKNLSKGTK